VKECKSDLNATAPSLLASLPRWGEREKIKTNPSVSPFRKGRDKNEKIFLIPSPFGACAKNREKHKKQKTSIQK